MAEEKSPLAKSDTRLSYSSSTLLANCSMKYWHYKVARTPRDIDAPQESKAFDVGKAFHWVLEMTKHTDEKLEWYLDRAVTSFECEDSKAMIHAMLLKYLKMQSKSGLTIHRVETEISNKLFYGVVDALMVDELGNWWIVDLKTAARLSEITMAGLGSDVQLSLYSSFYVKIAEVYGLDANKFMGARYRVTTKSTLKQKASENYKAFVLRMYGGIKSCDIAIPKDRMKPMDMYLRHKRLHALSQRLRSEKSKPERNFSYCNSFFKPCEYWSQCHGKTITDCKEEFVTL
jgi:hypothetical protein